MLLPLTAIFIFLPRYFVCACMYVSSEVIKIQCMPREKKKKEIIRKEN